MVRAYPRYVSDITRYAPHGMVCSVDHLASEAGVAVLRAGGTAVDAAIAANAVLAVTAPHMCGLGGDLFALVHDRAGPPAALNASGRAGSGADPDALRARGLTAMPFRHDIASVTVPGCVDGWLALHGRYGRLPIADLLAPAIGYAADGFPASPLLVRAVAQLPDPADADGVLGAGVPDAGDLRAATGVPGAAGPGGAPGRNGPDRARGVPGAARGAAELRAAYRTGARVRRPGIADALRAIVAGGRDGFYGGPFGAGLRALGGGLFTAGDLARPCADWVEPIGVPARGHRVWTTPPNSQGYLITLGLAIAEGLDLGDPADPRWAHLMIEAARQAGRDRPEVLHEHADVAPLLAPAEVARRRSGIDGDRAADLLGLAAAGDTTYLCAVDADRMGVSLIQSNASGFGSLLFEPATGINLQNRGVGFSLRRGHPAEYGPGRRPPHTLAPVLVTGLDGALRAVAGTMGGDAQPQIMLQILTRMLAHGETPGSAIDAGRVQLTGAATGFDTWDGPALVAVEDGVPPRWPTGLAERGHSMAVQPRTAGHAHAIEVTDGMLAGAADPRAGIGAATGY